MRTNVTPEFLSVPRTTVGHIRRELGARIEMMPMVLIGTLYAVEFGMHYQVLDVLIAGAYGFEAKLAATRKGTTK